MQAGGDPAEAGEAGEYEHYGTQCRRQPESGQRKDKGAGGVVGWKRLPPGRFVDQGPDGVTGIRPRPVDQPPEDVGAEKGQSRGEDCAQKAPGNAVPPEQDQQFRPIDAEENWRQQFDGPFPERFPAGRFPPEGQQPVILAVRSSFDCCQDVRDGGDGVGDREVGRLALAVEPAAGQAIGDGAFDVAG